MFVRSQAFDTVATAVCSVHGYFPASQAAGGRVTKSVILVTPVYRLLQSRKCLSRSGLRAEDRRENPLSGGGSAENGTRFRFLRAEKPAGIEFCGDGWGRFPGPNRGD